MRQQLPSMGPRFFRSCNLLPNGRQAVTWGDAVLRLVVSATTARWRHAAVLSSRYLAAFTRRPMAYATLDNYSTYPRGLAFDAMSAARLAHSRLLCCHPTGTSLGS